jgi:hypothetical protein
MSTEQRNEEDLVQINPHVTEETRDEFKEYVRENTGKVRGEFGRHVEKAMNEYMDNDRLSRVERKLDALLQKDSEERKTPSDGQNRTDKRLSEIEQKLNKEGATFSQDTVERVIRNVAGHSDKTIKKYLQLLQDRHMIFPNPVHDRFFREAHDFVQFVERHTYGEGQAGVTEEQYNRLKDTFGRDWWEERVQEFEPEVKREIGVEVEEDETGRGFQ